MRVLERWETPFVVSLLTPLVVYPVYWLAFVAQDGPCTSEGFIPAYEECPTSVVMRAALPGLLDLLPLLWLLIPGTVRRAAFVAGVLGAARFVVPAGLILASSPTVEVRWLTAVPWRDDAPILLAFAALWLASAVVFALLLLVAWFRAQQSSSDAPEGFDPS